jgi:hypothetical protein
LEWHRQGLTPVVKIRSGSQGVGIGFFPKNETTLMEAGLMHMREQVLAAYGPEADKTALPLGLFESAASTPYKIGAGSLILACGDSGPVFVYSAAFEATRIRELAIRFPDLAQPLERILERIVDLLPVARNRYYYPSQQGSWSIKAVLPAVVPDLSYDKLEGVSHGGAAQEAFSEAIQPGIASERKKQIEGQLLAYCRLDTFAMVRLWQFFTGRPGAQIKK